MNGHILLANLIVVVHLLYVMIVVVLVPLIIVGGLLKWKWVRNFWLRLIHVIMIGIVVVETICGVTCPLTTWETNLRMEGGQYEFELDEQGNYIPYDDGTYKIGPTKEYQQDFVARCARAVLFFDPEEVAPWVLNSFYYGFGAMILITLFLIPPRWPWRKQEPQDMLAKA